MSNMVTVRPFPAKGQTVAFVAGLFAAAGGHRGLSTPTPEAGSSGRPGRRAPVTWVYEAALLVTGITAVYGVAHSLAWRTGKEWVSVAGACVAAFLIGWALVPHSPVSLPGLL